MNSKYTQKLTKAFIADEQDIPEWVVPVALLLMGVLILWLAVGVISGREVALQQPVPQNGVDQIALIGGTPAVTGGTSGSPETPAVISDNTAVGTPRFGTMPDSGDPDTGTNSQVQTKNIYTVGGASVQVDQTAYLLAVKAGEARFTGDWEGVPTAGNLPPVGLVRWPDADTTEVQLDVDLPDGYVFIVIVDPDKDGPETARTTTIVIKQASDGTWNYVN